MDNFKVLVSGQQVKSSAVNFQMTLANEVTVSIGIGTGHYCDNGQTTCEIAAFDKAGWVIPADWDDSVKGDATPNEVIDFINWCKTAR